ncbi:MAG: flagellar basal body rod protein FlgC [Candidatus Loosdrechtia sp.]|uniref:flagellar basal body rod protein FlgC n=1 Tax=Candidatus Loosdrechtia sp. TaxID=3101272 RepID=UPI003A6EC159|nr:MAG: flagellar basal body rod protein FlgC [Candidatus Jettenia sp. AMX2]
MSVFDKPLSVFDISASGLSAAKVKMGVIASNIANAQVTETPGGGPYRRKEVQFATVLNKSMIGGSSIKDIKLNGVKIMGVKESTTPPLMVYMPGHPHADEQGFVSMPNVSISNEMVDMISASRSYEANTSVISALRKMNNRALDIIRR